MHKGVRLFIVILWCFVWNSSANGQFYNPDSVKCNTHKVGENYLAFDSVLSSFLFEVIDENNQPVQGIQVLLENGMQETTDKDGKCSIGEFTSGKPMKIQFLKEKIVLYEFTFEQNLVGYGYSIYFKLCE